MIAIPYTYILLSGPRINLVLKPRRGRKFPAYALSEFFSDSQNFFQTGVQGQFCKTLNVVDPAESSTDMKRHGYNGMQRPKCRKGANCAQAQEATTWMRAVQ